MDCSCYVYLERVSYGKECLTAAYSESSVSNVGLTHLLHLPNMS